jgi:hypothetical protein
MRRVFSLVATLALLDCTPDRVTVIGPVKPDPGSGS